MHAAPLQVIVVAGAPVSAPVTTLRTVASAAPAGAPPAWPALAIQSRNEFRSASSMCPDDALHAV